MIIVYSLVLSQAHAQASQLNMPSSRVQGVCNSSVIRKMMKREKKSEFSANGLFETILIIVGK